MIIQVWIVNGKESLTIPDSTDSTTDLKDLDDFADDDEEERWSSSS